MILVSIDDHVCEPPDIFVRHISPKYKGQEPQVVTSEHGQAWVIEGKKNSGLGLNAVVGRPKEEYGMEPMSFDHLRAGTYDIHARIYDMDDNGVPGAMQLPPCPGVAGIRLPQQTDKG